MALWEKLVLDKEPPTKRPVRPCSVAVAREFVVFKDSSCGPQRPLSF